MASDYAKAGPEFQRVEPLQMVQQQRAFPTRVSSAAEYEIPFRASRAIELPSMAHVCDLGVDMETTPSIQLERKVYALELYAGIDVLQKRLTLCASNA